jgi:hypothetical protein
MMGYYGIPSRRVPLGKHQGKTDLPALSSAHHRIPLPFVGQHVLILDNAKKATIDHLLILQLRPMAQLLYQRRLRVLEVGMSLKNSLLLQMDQMPHQKASRKQWK